MRYMIIVKSSQGFDAGKVTPSKKIIDDMIAFHEELAKAGVLVEGNGLHRSDKGWRVKYSGDKRTVVDGPFTEAKELIAGFTMIQVRSREEAMEWARRFPRPFDGDCEIEVRQVMDSDDVPSA